MSIKKESFGHLPDGREVFAYSLANLSGTAARISDFGGTIINLWVKDKNGVAADVICGFDTIDGYLNASGYQGALIGRVCNRISSSRFTLDGVTYELFPNDGKNSAHGGKIGFNKRVWDVRIISDGDEPALELSYISPDMEENYPGTLTVTVIYKLTADGALSIANHAVTDKKTILNLTNHAYLNLAGFDSGTIKNQLLWIDASRMNEHDYELIPTGNFIDIAGTAYDFTIEKPVGRDFSKAPDMDKQGGGYDNNFIFNNYKKEITKRASLRDPVSGRFLIVYTDEPCMQIYTSNMIDENDLPFKNNTRQIKNCGICFETQKMPDSINHPGFTSTVLSPGEVYDYTTIFQFGCQ